MSAAADIIQEWTEATVSALPKLGDKLVMGVNDPATILHDLAMIDAHYRVRLQGLAPSEI